ncbi:TBC-domain-containing protein [Sistotremastrum niveocremeum HHB9708]|uniref:TBC-domain-containing protein n=2 Tax=Sistotremastraceae TaxID=3402574 RepID=A0A164STR7_9AGAM|nr:TBC-domain-containing protein [Sistotremastrum niveocremeum HHB9708]KZT40375.1 TBC-domain-containing protein [Sistotremastrum suecicum HHB10207 ss-3]
MEAHRARELKWMSTIQSTSHKSKKLRKMLQEPVPSSVRYQVWSHLVDAKAKRMPNIYSDLSKRPRVGASANIEKDADRYFPEHPHLKDPRGPLVSLLNAYFAMVPDITYQAGLVIIAGHLLLQSPEEDAFWMFLALMDQHLRPYFSPGAYQLEADASLFQKYLEANDAPMSKRLFVNDVRPIDLCGPWFSSMFAGTLPTEHLCRVWDIFFYEGPVILFRVGLEILRIYRRRIFDSPASPAGSAWLTRPLPPTMLPDPETFLSDALSVKLKDDDLRKQRVKMEATIRKQQPGSSRGLTMNSTLIRKT